MNFINQSLLRIAMLPQSLYRKMNVNTSQLYTILKTKLLIDNRRPFSLKSMGRQQQKETNNSSVATTLVSLLMGLLFLMAFGIDGLELQMALYFSMMICLLASILITDFTSVLIDVRDNYIILPKPVNDQTVVLARVLHIMLHVFKIIIPMSLPGIIAIAIVHGIGTMLIFATMVLFCTLFTLFLINLIYVLILKIVPPERFKTVISFIQIILAIFVYGFYQFVPRIITRVNFNLSANKTIYLLPPYWFAAAIKTISTFSATHLEVMATVLAFLFPVTALYIMIRFLAPFFNKKISSINTVTDTALQIISANYRQRKIRQSYSNAMANIMVKDKIEKTGFLFSWKIGNRSRDFYMKVYPAFGYIIVLFFMLSLGNKKISLQDIPHLNATDSIVKQGTIYITYYFICRACPNFIFR